MFQYLCFQYLRNVEISASANDQTLMLLYIDCHWKRQPLRCHTVFCSLQCVQYVGAMDSTTQTEGDRKQNITEQKYIVHPLHH